MLQNLESKARDDLYCYSKSANALDWVLLEADGRLIRELSKGLNIDDVVSTILAHRGILSLKEAHSFLNGKLKDTMPDPFLMQDMDVAANRIIEAVEKKQKVVLFADYDVDGATSASVLFSFFKLIGIDVKVYIPDRILEGYGPNIEALRKLKRDGADLIITLDCGTTAYEPFKVAHDLGLDVIVIDHHIALEQLPKATAIVNPNRQDDLFPEKSIAAVAVVFFTIVAVRKKLRDTGWFSHNKLQEPDLMQFLDLVALGTVCDVMPLSGINRIFVKHGLALIAKRNNLGIATLLDLAKLNSKPSAYHLGYVIGPRINAGGRVGESKLGFLLLTAENHLEAFKVAVKLEELNKERKTIESLALENAFAYIEKAESSLDLVMFAVGHDWHIGVIGILASRIKERYHKPSIVISVENGIGKGSARSVPGIDIGHIITEAKAKGLLIEGGGHAMAGGFSIKSELISDFKEYVQQHVYDIENSSLLIKRASEIYIDAVISAQAAGAVLMEVIKSIEPFGNANPAPRFAIYQAKICKVSIFGLVHIALFITDSISAKGYLHSTSQPLKCLFFRGLEKNIGALLIKSVGKIIDVIGNLQENKMDKTGVQFVIEDLILYE